MKTNILYLSLFYILSAVSLCGCSNDDEPVATDGTTLTVIARADGFISTDGTPQTRASESDYTTNFVKDDRIGVFAMKNGKVITGCKNVPCTYDGTSWSGTVYKYPGATYFAYYPYEEDLNTSDITSTNDIVTTFNTNVTAATDQSTYANYTACDLMTTDDVSPTSGTSLSFSFKHQMSLIEIFLPVQKFKTTSDASAYEYSAPILGAAFSLTSNSSGATTIKPYPMGNGVYRYIVPASASVTISGAFDTADDGKTIEYSKASLSLSAGNYKRLNVTYDGASAPIERPLAVGDFYYSDGSICPGDVSNPPSESCIGIVLRVGYDGSKDDSEYVSKGGQSMSPIHGYVLALYDANGGSTCKWGPSEETGTKTDQDSRFDGYKNTQIIKTYATNNSKDLQNDFPATYHVTDGYESQYPAPSNSSGWFLPSGGQCKCWLGNGTVLLASVQKAIGNSSYKWKSWYWSSSERASNSTSNVYAVSFTYSMVAGMTKSNTGYVRACLAF